MNKTIDFSAVREDELFAIELEIKEIDSQINRLRHQRSGLIKRQQQLKANQRVRTSTSHQSLEQWNRTGFSHAILFFRPLFIDLDVILRFFLEYKSQ